MHMLQQGVVAMAIMPHAKRQWRTLAEHRIRELCLSPADETSTRRLIEPQKGGHANLAVSPCTLRPDAPASTPSRLIHQHWNKARETELTIRRQFWIALRFDPPYAMIDRLSPIEQDVGFACAMTDVTSDSAKGWRLDCLWNSSIPLSDPIRPCLSELVDAEPDCGDMSIASRSCSSTEDGLDVPM